MEMWALIIGVALVLVIAWMVIRDTERHDIDTSPGDDPPADPEGPWSPRPYAEEPRRHLLPILAAVWALVLIGAVVALGWVSLGQDQLLVILSGESAEEHAPKTTSEIETEEPPEETPTPYLIEVPIEDLAAPAPPSPEPTPAPTPQPTPAPAPQVTPPPAPAAGPSIDASASCDEGTVNVRYTLRAPDDGSLEWYTLYLNGETVGGGSISGAELSETRELDAGAGSHDVEVTVRDSGGGREAYRAGVTCS